MRWNTFEYHSLNTKTTSVPFSSPPEDALTHLGSDDPYLRTEAVRSLTQHPDVLSDYKWQADTKAVARAYYAVAMKRLDAGRHEGIMPTGLLECEGQALKAAE